MDRGGSIALRVALAILGYAAIIAIVVLVDRVLDWWRFDEVGYRVLGAVLLVGGGYLAFRSSSLLVESFGLRDPESRFPVRLVDWGPYGHVRNPMGLGMGIALVGIGLLLGSLMLVFAAVASVVMAALLIVPSEERDLQNLFGEDYERYRDQVSGWMPRPSPFGHAPVLSKDVPDEV